MKDRTSYEVIVERDSSEIKRNVILVREVFGTGLVIGI